jgi:hypothetical protein
LKAVRVFAVNRDMDRSMDETKSADSARTVSLLLQPEHVEKLMMAAKLGDIRLALRSPDDPRVDATAGCTSHQVLGTAGVADDITPDGVLASLSRPDGELPMIADGNPAWTMTVITPHGTQRYRWSDVRDLPDTEMSSPSTTAPETEPANTPPADSDEPRTPAKELGPLEVARAAGVFDSAD